MKKAKFLNLVNNKLKTLPKTLNGTSFSQVYLAGNPIDCNCHMLWFAYWLNTTEPECQNRNRERLQAGAVCGRKVERNSGL